VAGMNSEKLARRTAVATGPNQRCALIYLTSITLADAAEILSLPKILSAWTPATALNLDGGSSSTLWARDIISLPEIKRVRNFLEVVPR
ncbi:MAG: phosphodiester glycosidase family protein, partial [Spartobacteria bacterium]